MIATMCMQFMVAYQRREDTSDAEVLQWIKAVEDTIDLHIDATVDNLTPPLTEVLQSSMGLFYEVKRHIEEKISKHHLPSPEAFYVFPHEKDDEEESFIWIN